MVDRNDVNRLNETQHRIVARLREALADRFTRLDLTQPEAVRDMLLDTVPGLVQRMGEDVAAAAAIWYDEISPDDAYRALAADPIPQADIQRDIRFQAGELFGEEPEKTLDAILRSVQRYVNYSTRQTVARNVELDPRRPRFARVPSGPTTCAWCTMLASRGWVYRSRASAGEVVGSFHDDCDCQIVPEWDRDNAHIEGYDPGRLFAQYTEARDDLLAEGNRNPTDREIAARMRALAPLQVADAGNKQIIDAGRPDPTDKDGYRRWRLARTQLLHAGVTGEALEEHELDFYEAFKADGQRFRLIPRPPRRESDGKRPSSNDMVWTSNGFEVVEVKAQAPNKYSAIKEHIKRSTLRAREWGVTKDAFVIRLAHRPSSALRAQLGSYNRRAENAQIRRLWVYSPDGLEEIVLE